MPMNAFPEPLRRFIHEVALSMGKEKIVNEMAAAYVGAFTLSVVSGAIGRTFQLKIKKEYNVIPAIWAAIVGDSGVGKSPMLKPIVAPVLEFYHRQRERYDEAVKEYESQMTVYLTRPVLNRIASFCPSESRRGRQ
ncbi:MAG: DUF3987 domain-containing protein [Planctomycetaceae bacterium]|jgi:hypothetical protein|nr:DUF3987 domain-containing protein [Planctomycetaceae bacterium]